MPRFILLVSFGIISLIPSYGQKEKLEKLIPKEPIGWVSDFDNVFTPGQIQILDSLISSHNLEKGNQIAIVTLTVDSLSINSFAEFEELSLLLFNQWGVGQKNLNTGIGIIFSRNLRMIRIEVGEGLTSKLTDEEAKSIIDNIIIPDFKKSNYYQGVLNCLQRIISEIQ